MELDRDVCIRALDARDSRFDGVFYVAVMSTRVYCRPICPARRANRDRCLFFATAVEAEHAGYRPCLRCRPELAPGRARVDAVPRLAERAVKRIAAGALNGRSVDALARDLGVSGRQLRRALERELGVSPLELAQTHRLLVSKQLLTETSMTLIDVAFASGFQSVRRFNAAFRERYRMSPGRLRPRRPLPASDGVRLTLAYRPPLAWGCLLDYLRPLAMPGVEHVGAHTLTRTVALNGHTGILRLGPCHAETPVLEVEISETLVPVVVPLLRRVRTFLDLDADPRVIDQHLAHAGLGALVRSRPGLRLPGAFDAFEVALRAAAGQRVPLPVARERMRDLAARFGMPLETRQATLDRLAPGAERLADARVSAIASPSIPQALAGTLQALARLVADGTLRLEEDADPEPAIEALAALPGITRSTAELIVMHAIGWPDTFPAAHPALRRAAGSLSTHALVARAEKWRPWRAYAAMQLWSVPATDAAKVHRVVSQVAIAT